jgi:CDP-diacylglycerol--serine O-phosphatidyltransferase
MFKKFIPNFLTLTNLSFGVLSILELMKQNYCASALFIMMAAFIDRYDGKIARLLNVSSEIGKELDSLADLISFGVAPALLVFHKFNFLNLGTLKGIGVCCLLLYIMCGSYRLARYNISEFDGAFIGVPITVAGFILALYALVIPVSSVAVLLSIILLLLSGFCMVSKFEFKKF